MVKFLPLGECGKWAEFDGSAMNVIQDEFRTFFTGNAVEIWEILNP